MKIISNEKILTLGAKYDKVLIVESIAL